MNNHETDLNGSPRYPRRQNTTMVHTRHPPEGTELRGENQPSHHALGSKYRSPNIPPKILRSTTPKQGLPTEETMPRRHPRLRHPTKRHDVRTPNANQPRQAPRPHHIRPEKPSTIPSLPILPSIFLPSFPPHPIHHPPTNPPNQQVLSHLQSQATMKMENLTISMHEIGVLAQREAIAMRIITVVTLIYLPATFVSVSRPQPTLSTFRSKTNPSRPSSAPT